jgi:DeoR/GlpR family transcriptional regulator of sugar metabolism
VLTAERKELLLDRLRIDGRVIAKAIAVELDVSEDTVRRDLRELAGEGKLQRVHGGALPASPANSNFSVRSDLALEGKAAVASTAAKLILPNQTVVIDGGTTAQLLARHLPLDLLATVITHSPTIAIELLNHSNIEVLIIGGRLFKHSMVTCGALASEAIERVRADTFFMGVTGVHPTEGLTTGDAEEASIKRSFSHRCAETYVLASSEKIGAAAPFNVVGLTQIAGVITDQSADRKTLKALEKKGVPVIVG